MEYAYFLVWSLRNGRTPKKISSLQGRNGPSRELGAIEKFLARTIPGTGKVRYFEREAISVSCMFC
jgi:hypothetical protein